MVRLTDRPDMTLDVYGGRKKHCNKNPPTRVNGLAVLEGSLIRYNKATFVYSFFVSSMRRKPTNTNRATVQIELSC